MLALTIVVKGGTTMARKISLMDGIAPMEQIGLKIYSILHNDVE